MNKRLRRITDRARTAEDILDTPAHELSQGSKDIAERLMAPDGAFDLRHRYAGLARFPSPASSGTDPESGLRLALAIGYPAAARQVLNPSEGTPRVDSRAIAQKLMAPGGPFCLDALFAKLAAGLEPSAPSTPQIVALPRLRELEQAFMRLSPDERDDEIARHVWAEKDPSRPRTVWSDLLNSWDVGNDNLVSDAREA